MSWIEEPRGCVLLADYTHPAAGRFLEAGEFNIHEGGYDNIYIYYKAYGLVSESPKTKEPPITQKRSYKIEKRKTIAVKEQQLDNISLNFLSTGPGSFNQYELLQLLITCWS